MTPEHPDLRAQARIRERMRRVDAMPPALRQCVHDFGLTLVDQFVMCGVSNPRHIRHLITACWDTSQEVGKRKHRDARERRLAGGS